MRYNDHYDSRNFFKSQWNKPFRRLRKAALPVVVSGIGVFLVMSCFFAFLPWFITDSGDNLFTVIHTTLAVLIGVAVAFLGHLIQLRRLSRFETIKIRVRPKK